jgi:hypothetical protein
MTGERPKGLRGSVAPEDAHTNPEQRAGKSKPRSPGYPGIDLSKAIERAGALYKQQNRYEAATETILQHWGYKGKTGPGLVTLAALKAFGLLEAGKESGKFKLSDLALAIVLDERDGAERLSSIRRAALNPAIHKVMWEKYHGVLPADANLRFFLQSERQFTPDGAGQFIAQYKATLEFADLLGHDRLPGSDGDPAAGSAPVHGFQSATPPPTPPARAPLPGALQEIPIPIAGATWPALKGAFPMSEAAWTQMLEVLKAMKPGLVEGTEKRAPTDDEPG